MFVIFDLDGTLANCDARVSAHLLCPERGYPHKREKVDWRAFFADCGGDTPIDHAIEIVRALLLDHTRSHKVEIWTGRSDECRAETERWLGEHIGWGWEGAVKLRMRKAGDHRHDDVVKTEWIAEHGKPDLVFEDRARVVKAWRSLGVACYQVAEGEF